MIDLLLFLARDFGFLFESGRFKFVDSRGDGGSRGSAMLVLESPSLRLRFTHHQGERLLEFQPYDGAGKQWFSLGLLRGVRTGDRGGSEVLDTAWARFLDESLEELEADFDAPSRRTELVGKLREQARLRADALFPKDERRARDIARR